MYTYDLETYPNIFTLAATRVSDNAQWLFEVSTRRNDAVEIYGWLHAITNSGGRLVGYNNLGFDYPIIHLLLQNNGQVTCADLYNKAMSIINSNDRFGNAIWDKDIIVPQIDLFKIHHFDNMAKSTSLKMLEFNMRSPNIEDLPYPPGTVLNNEQMDHLIEYNKHDVSETVKFLKHSEGAIKFREELTLKYSRNFMNHNDTKIGKDYFIMKLEESGVQCFTKSPRAPIQTPRPSINLADVVFPYIQFVTPEFNHILNWFKQQTITETKGVFKDAEVNLHGFKFVFGLGGIHGSQNNKIAYSDDDYVVRDCDVSSYYPSVGIVNKLYPEHLGEKFPEIYKEVKTERFSHKKGTVENAMLKLALNGVYGDSNNQYSPFYDPMYTMKTTINGQLMLCMLAEQLMSIPGIEMLQINTDGMTVRMLRSLESVYDYICQWWQEFTLLDLEFADYNRMFIRDVNSYISEYDNGKLKRIGAYASELVMNNPGTRELLWEKNHSSVIVALAAEAALVRGEDIEQFIRNHKDIYDFMLRTKVPRSSKLMLEYVDGTVRQCQNITRYYITYDGGSLIKVMPPTPKQIQAGTFGVYHYHNTRGGDFLASTPKQLEDAKKRGYTFIGHSVPPVEDRRIGISVGWLVTECNDISKATAPINYDYYIQEAKKLVEPLR